MVLGIGWCVEGPHKKPQQLRQMKRRESNRALRAVREEVLSKIEKIETEVGSKHPPPVVDDVDSKDEEK
jgi:hypothetical protein